MGLLFVFAFGTKLIYDLTFIDIFLKFLAGLFYPWSSTNALEELLSLILKCEGFIKCGSGVYSL